MKWMPKQVALTGAGGMVGRHAASALERNRIFCVGSGRAQWDLRQWLDDSELDHLFGASDAIIHAGAAVPSPGLPVSEHDIFDANVRSCLCLGEWSRKRGKPLIFVSGAVVYANTNKAGICEEDQVTTRPTSNLYGLSKLLAEQLLDNLVGRGLELCVLRPSSVYGAGMPETRMVASMLGKAQRNEDITLQAPTGDRINLLHAADLADAIVAVLCARVQGIFNVAGSRTLSIAEIAASCVEATGNGRVVLPENNGTEASIKYDLDCSKAKLAFGYLPRVNLLEGLRRSMSGQF